MKSILRTLLLPGVLLAMATNPVHAYTVYLDMDVGTPVGPPPPPGSGPLPDPPPGMDASISVTSGTTITIIAYIVHSTGTATFDSVGIDINHTLPGDSALAVPVAGTNFAGGLAGAGPPGTIGDLVAAVPTGPGAPLASAGLPPMPPAAGSIGGSGMFDSTPGASFGGFGAGAGPPSVGTYYDVMGMDFTITGAVGDVVTFMPSGIFTPGFFGPGTPPPVVPLTVGGDAVYDSLGGFTSAGAYVGGTVTIVPEPSVLMLIGFGCLGLFLRHRR